jgi:poly [ADP-ribose] polymerase
MSPCIETLGHHPPALSLAMSAPDRTPIRQARLVMVSAENNNKFYHMTDQGDGTFVAEYGRVGATPASRRYDAAQWDKKYREKVRKGYRDVSALTAEGDAPPPLDVDCPAVRALVEQLVRYAERSVEAHYLVASESVTGAMVDEAQAALDAAVRAAESADATAVNAALLALYQTIPRRMANVRDHLCSTDAPALDADEAQRALERLSGEQATLDVLAGEVAARRSRAESPTTRTLADVLGAEVSLVTDEVVLDIRRRMGEEAGRFRRAFRVTNPRTERAFQAQMAQAKKRGRSRSKTELLWHGSRNENWRSILRAGLVLRPANAVITGKMFGYGLYFAQRFQKSLGYTSARWGSQQTGFLALYEVHLGRQLRVDQWESWCSALTADHIRSHGRLRRAYDSVHGRAGCSLRNDEFIVYDEAQCTVRYLVEVGPACTA